MGSDLPLPALLWTECLDEFCLVGINVLLTQTMWLDGHVLRPKSRFWSCCIWCLYMYFAIWVIGERVGHLAEQLVYHFLKGTRVKSGTIWNSDHDVH
jgi:hypothetical protein